MVLFQSSCIRMAQDRQQLTEPFNQHGILIDINAYTNPLLPADEDYATPTLPLIPSGPDVVLENPYTEIEVTNNIPLPPCVQSGEEGPPSIVCMFVVLFHVTRGHEIVWSHPQDLDLDGVDLKAVPSGMHTVDRDFIYFRKAGEYILQLF